MKTNKSEIKEERNLGYSVVITKPGKIKKIPFKYNGLREDEVLVKMKGCSIYDDDIACWEGNGELSYPLSMGMPGRDGWGIVEEAGKFSKLKKGDLVALISDKCLSEYMICNHQQLVKLPAQFQNMVFPAEAFAYAQYLFNQAKIKKGQTIVILGKGFFSKVISKLASKKGAELITIAYTQDQQESELNKNGEKIYNWYESQNVLEKVIELTNGTGCDCVIEFTGSQPSIDFANKILASNGTLILAKKSASPIEIGHSHDCNLKLVCANDLDNYERIKNINSAVKAVEKKIIDPSHFISHHIKFEDVGEAFSLICNNPKDYLKCVVTF